MSLNSMGFGFVFTLRDLASAGLAKLENRFRTLDERVSAGTSRMTQAFRQLSMGLAGLTAGAVVLAGTFRLAEAAGRFRQGLASVGAVARATTEQMEGLRDATIQAGIRTQFSPEEAVEGLQSLATAGQTVEQATRSLLPVLDLAAGSLGQLGVAQAAEAVVGTLNAYGLAAERAAGVTDKLLRITQLTNFQTKDFEGGLAKAAATGSVFGQSMNDVLITMGLLRNRNIDASSAATAFRESVRRVGAESRAQEAVLGAQVGIFDKQTGRMRSIVDIMGDFARATRSMTEEERNRRVAVAFGARGLLAFNAVLNATFTTMRDGQQVVLKGAEAVEALRHQMHEAGGTAERFRNKLLDTFQGQRTLLLGTLQTFAVVLGEPFAKVFKPIVTFVVETLNGLLRAFESLPATFQQLFAGALVGGSVLTLLVGTILAVKVSVVLLGMAMSALGITIGGVLAAVAPFVLSVTGLGVVIAGVVTAIRKDLGGVGEFLGEIGTKTHLFWSGLQQLFSQGGFSSAVREKFTRAEHQSLKLLVIALYQVAYRARRIWEGFREGFISVLEASAPMFGDFVAMLHDMGQNISGVFSGIVRDIASISSDPLTRFGQRVGGAIALMVQSLVGLLTMVGRVVSGLFSGFKTVSTYLGLTFNELGASLGQLTQAWRRLLGLFTQSTDTATSLTWILSSLAKLVGGVLATGLTAAVYVLTQMAEVLTVVVDAVTAVGTAFHDVYQGISSAGEGIYRWFAEAIPHAVTTTLRLVRSMVGVCSSIGRSLRQTFERLYGFMAHILQKFPRAWVSTSTVQLKDVTPTEGLATSSTAMPAVAAEVGRQYDLAQQEAQRQHLAKVRPQPDAAPIHIQLQVDGETLARATHNANRDAAVRSYAPLPAY